MRKPSHLRGKPALDLIEEAVQELRRTPAQLWLAYYAGTIPFALGLLYFWADMSYAARAAWHCATLALMLAVLFVWMKCCQTVFASGLRQRIAGDMPLPWTVRRMARVFLAQAVIQPSKLLVLPLAALTVLLFPWTQAFYEGITCAGNGGQPVAVRELISRAARQAAAWPGQNIVLALTFVLLGVTLWFNAAVAVAVLPGLFKTLLGVESVFTQSGGDAIVNTTFLSATVAFAALLLDPLVKTVYVLRGFYSEARHDGADLDAELMLVRRNSGMTGLAAAVMFALAVSQWPALAADPQPAAPVPTTATSATPAELQQAIKNTLAQDKYTWRLPREMPPTTDASVGWLQAFLQSLGNTLAQWAHAIFNWIHDVMHWIHKHFSPKPAEEPASPGIAGQKFLVRSMTVVLVILVAGALGVLLWRYGRMAWRQRSPVTAEILPAAPDLEDENTTAAQLPEDEWLRLARELAAKGDLRLALRALYLGSLAHLASRELVSIARFKSNRDYQLEIARRARARPELRQAFDENVAVFDCVWYGLYAVTAESFGQFRANVERIRTC